MHSSHARVTFTRFSFFAIIYLSRAAPHVGIAYLGGVILWAITRATTKQLPPSDY
ncbi:MAG: hypothetical protein ACYCWN_04570 [Ferrimicrobium sp.]|uniref:Uncharacterized protein n=1 Tax=Ferrimicrobium acidiphilum TaxID=121039 RepID=A0ABV3XZ29_9ACTN|nr:hypothetical protein [Ferrimicrobium sp.]